MDFSPQASIKLKLHTYIYIYTLVVNFHTMKSKFNNKDTDYRGLFCKIRIIKDSYSKVTIKITIHKRNFSARARIDPIIIQMN